MGGDLQKSHFPNITTSDTYSNVTGGDFPAAARAVMRRSGPRHLPLKVDGHEATAREGHEAAHAPGTIAAHLRGPPSSRRAKVDGEEA